MLTNSVLLFISAYVIIYSLVLFCVLTGKTLLSSVSALPYFSNSVYSTIFYSFIFGLFAIISLYAIIVTKGVTINILVPLLLFLIGWKSRKESKNLAHPVPRITARRYAEIAAICLLSLFILHVFPVNEYKQADGFFYLKIAEGLNASGQENISHYFNLYSSDFHGTEPYHYFEIWITAFITRFTGSFLPSVLVERYITQGLLLSAVIPGLYMLASVVLQRRLKVADKLMCWSMLFIFPNLLIYFPKLYQVFISDFEGNLIDRPNFKILYLLLLPAAHEMLLRKSVTVCVTCFLLLLSIASFQFAIVFLPGVILYALHCFATKKPVDKFSWLFILLFSFLFSAFYFAYSVKNLPSLFTTGSNAFALQTLSGFKFILFSIFTSTVYVIVLATLMLFPIIILFKKHFVDLVKYLAKHLSLFICIGISGIILARLLYLKDNAYQFIFVTHIILTFLIWLIYLHFIKNEVRAKASLVACIYPASFFFIYWIVTQNNQVDIFKQNGKYVYNAKPYSSKYITEVNSFFKNSNKPLGGYLANTAFYASTYYSRRNPNVYFLPITYIVANINNNVIDFCLSDTAAIKYGLTEQMFKDYLDNAISRSLFYRFRAGLPNLNYQNAVVVFISTHKLQYLIVTQDYPVDSLQLRVKQQYKDASTGEKFLILE